MSDETAARILISDQLAASAGAVNARFLASRHGLRFEITLHTTASWDAFTTHSEYMRRRFDTVIKTDVLYGADEDKIQKAKSEMRREEMWRDRWARIQVPDRTLSESTHTVSRSLN